MFDRRGRTLARGQSMNPLERIRTSISSLERARKCLDDRSDREIVKQLGLVLERFRDPESAARRRLETELPETSGFSAEMVRAGLDLAFDPWTSDALERLVAKELGSGSNALSRAGFERTSVLLAGSIPMPSVLSILLPLVLRSPVLCKPASRDPLTPQVVADTLREVDPQLGDCVAVVPFDGDLEAANRAFHASPCISATGSDETIARVHALLRPEQRRVFYGHRISIGLVDLATLGPDDVEGLAIDIALWDQLGCLSPVVFFLVGGPEGAADTFAEDLAARLEALEARWPRGSIEPPVAAAIVGERADAEMRAALGQRTRLYASVGTAWSVVLERDFTLRSAPLHRFIRLVEVDHRDTLKAALATVAPHLAGVAMTGFEKERPTLFEQIFALGASRICAAGCLQTPPLDWRRDNQPLLLGMTKFGNHETG